MPAAIEAAARANTVRRVDVIRSLPKVESAVAGRSVNPGNGVKLRPIPGRIY
jgi:hypothetical protein